MKNGSYRTIIHDDFYKPDHDNKREQLRLKCQTIVIDTTHKTLETNKTKTNTFIESFREAEDHGDDIQKRTN